MRCGGSGHLWPLWSVTRNEIFIGIPLTRLGTENKVLFTKVDRSAAAIRPPSYKTTLSIPSRMMFNSLFYDLPIADSVRVSLKRKRFSLQDDHKISVEDVGKRYGVDLTRVMADARNLFFHALALARKRTTQSCFNVPHRDVIQARLSWKAASKARRGFPLVASGPRRRARLTSTRLHL